MPPRLMSPSVRSSHGRHGWLRSGSARATAVGYAPILDTERGVVAGVAATPARGRTLDSTQLATVLADRPAVPRNTFLSIPLAWERLGLPAVRAELLRPSDLQGIVFELVGITPSTCGPLGREVATTIQDAGGLLALDADDIWHPEFEAITDRAPRMVVIGSSWVHRIHADPKRQVLIEKLGEVAAERDAWVLGSAVSSPEELATLAALHVPLLSGPMIGKPDFAEWPRLAGGVTAVLGPQRQRPPGPMRDMLEIVETFRTLGDAAVAAVSSSCASGVAVVLDVYGRPTGLARRTEGGVRATEDVLCVHVDTTLRDVMNRARSRPASADPLLAIDSAGRFLGIVTMAALADAR